MLLFRVGIHRSFIVDDLVNLSMATISVPFTFYGGDIIISRNEDTLHRIGTLKRV